MLLMVVSDPIGSVFISQRFSHPVRKGLEPESGCQNHTPRGDWLQRYSRSVG